MRTNYLSFLFVLCCSFLFAQPRILLDGTGATDDLLHLIGTSPFLRFCSGDCIDPNNYKGFLWSENGGGLYHLSLGTSYTNYNGDVRFYSGGGNIRMVIRPSGYVGIGTTIPSYKLHVLGGSGTAITGQSTYGYGIYGNSTYTVGVFGYSTASASAGIYGQSPYIGVQGITTNSSDNGRQGVRGDNFGSATGWAGYFYGNAGVSGTLFKGAGAFKIDHPLDPANKFLYHSFVESPDMKNIYDGVVTTDSQGEAEVELPEWFEALNNEFRYQLTVLGEFAQAIIAQEITNNRFRIKTDKPAVKVSWQVTGIRKDPYAEAYRIPLEVEKEDKQKGKYLHPDVYGQPRELAIDYRPPVKLPDGALPETEEQTNLLPTPTTDEATESGAPERNEHFIQSQPNPFNGTTTILYQLPADAQAAELLISDMFGRKIQIFPLDATSKTGQVEFNGKYLPKGNYTYTLIVNGKVLEGRQMVLSE